VDGKFEITYRPEERKPVKEYLAPQKRFRHLDEEHIEKIQKYVDAECKELGL
jgi:pyruvate ferredoxin oxidoreductase beta subunit